MVQSIILCFILIIIKKLKRTKINFFFDKIIKNKHKKEKKNLII